MKIPKGAEKGVAERRISALQHLCASGENRKESETGRMKKGQIAEGYVEKPERRERPARRGHDDRK